MYKCKIPVLLVVFAVFSGFVQAQEIQRSKGHFSGSLETNWGFYMKDDKLGVKKVEDKVATNTYLTLGYSFKAFRFGLEYDIYEPPMIGFSPECFRPGQGVKVKLKSGASSVGSTVLL